MWIYIQKTGQLFHNDDEIACGYSGQGECKNDPLAQSKHNFGPIPQGFYQIGPPHDRTDKGPFVLGLIPHDENRMYGRGGFLIHGDSIHEPGTASEGCIILGRAIRQRIWESGDHDLQVIPESVTEDTLENTTDQH